MKKLMITSQLSKQPHQASMPEPNGQATSTKSEIKVNAVHAGPSDLLKLSQTDSLLNQVEKSTLFFPQKI
jgi:hypothetical protein